MSKSHNPFDMVGAMLLGELLLIIFFAYIKVVSHLCHSKACVILLDNHISTLIKFHIYFGVFISECFIFDDVVQGSSCVVLPLSNYYLPY